MEMSMSLQKENSYGVDDIKSIRIFNSNASNPLRVSRMIKCIIPINTMAKKNKSDNDFEHKHNKHKISRIKLQIKAYKLRCSRTLWKNLYEVALESVQGNLIMV